MPPSYRHKRKIVQYKSEFAKKSSSNKRDYRSFVPGSTISNVNAFKHIGDLGVLKGDYIVVDPTQEIINSGRVYKLPPGIPNACVDNLLWGAAWRVGLHAVKNEPYQRRHFRSGTIAIYSGNCRSTEYEHKHKRKISVIRRKFIINFCEYVIIGDSGIEPV